MPTTGFHSEWVTIKGPRHPHRVLLECRASFPGHRERFIAGVAVECVDHNTADARVVKVYYDDKSCFHHVTVASVDGEDEKISSGLRSALSSIYNNGNCTVEVVVVAPGNTQSDHYEQMEHLSVGAEVAVDRWKHADEAYQAEVQTPR